MLRLADIGRATVSYTVLLPPSRIEPWSALDDPTAALDLLISRSPKLPVGCAESIRRRAKYVSYPNEDGVYVES